MIFGMAAHKLKTPMTLPQNISQKELPAPQVKEEHGLLSSLGIQVKYIDNFIGRDEALASLVKADSVFGLDIETTPLPGHFSGLDPKKSTIRLVQVFDSKKTVFVFDLDRIGGMAVFPTVLWDKPCVSHNALFEMKHLLKNGAVLKRFGCTLLADRIINGNRKELKPSLGLSKTATLKDLAQELLALNISKELQTSDWSLQILSPEQIEYAALDAVIVVKIFEKQMEILKQSNLMRPYKLLLGGTESICRDGINRHWLQYNPT